MQTPVYHRTKHQQEPDSRLPFDAHLFMNYEAIVDLVVSSSSNDQRVVQRTIAYGWGL